MTRLDAARPAAYPSAVRVLALDTSTALGTVAVTVDGELRAEQSARVEARHGESLLPLVADVLDKGRVPRTELDLIVVGIGPGSFTGTRVGVATAKGLAVGLGAPIVGVVTLRALAAAAPADRVATVVDAHKGEVFLAVYARTPDGLRSELAPDHVAPEAAAETLRALGPIARCGSGLRRYAEAFEGLEGVALPQLNDVPRASWVGALGEARFTASGPDDLALLEPLYVRGADAKLPGGVTRPGAS